MIFVVMIDWYLETVFYGSMRNNLISVTKKLWEKEKPDFDEVRQFI